jgi:hypothetical protein
MKVEAIVCHSEPSHFREASSSNWSKATPYLDLGKKSGSEMRKTNTSL